MLSWRDIEGATVESHVSGGINQDILPGGWHKIALQWRMGDGTGRVALYYDNVLKYETNAASTLATFPKSYEFGLLRSNYDIPADSEFYFDDAVLLGPSLARLPQYVYGWKE